MATELKGIESYSRWLTTVGRLLTLTFPGSVALAALLGIPVILFGLLWAGAGNQEVFIRPLLLLSALFWPIVLAVAVIRIGFWFEGRRDWYLPSGFLVLVLVIPTLIARPMWLLEGFLYFMWSPLILVDAVVK